MGKWKLVSFPPFPISHSFLGHGQRSSFQELFPLLKASAFQCKHCWCGLESSLLFLPSSQLNAFAKRNNFFSFLIKYLTFCKILNYTQKLQISEIFCSTSKQLKVITDVNTFIYPVTYLFIYIFI